MENNFTLKKFAVTSRGLIDCTYLEEITENDVTLISEKRVKLGKPLPDKLGQLLFGGLAGITGRILNVSESLLLPDSVVLAGKDENIGVTVSGGWKTVEGVARFKTPRIKYKAGDSAACAELHVFMRSFTAEVEKYLFGGEEMEAFDAE